MFNNKEIINGLLEREEWTRNRFEEIQEKISAIHEREEWTRNRFDEMMEHQEWARNRFDEVEEKISDIHAREEWTRNRFEEVMKQIQRLERLCVKNANADNLVGNIQDMFYNKKTYSQSGEDAIISYILNFMDYDLSKISYLDLGANHAIEMSNTYAYYQNGCKGVLLEANPELIPDLQRVRPNDVIINKAIAFGESGEMVDFYVMSGDGLSTISREEAEHACEVNPDLYIKEVYKIETITINDIFETYFEKSPEIMSIDLEGIEELILSQIDFDKWRPLIIILENIPYSPSLVIDQKENKAAEIFEKNGYVEYAFTGINSIYVDTKAISAFNDKILNRKYD